MKEIKPSFKISIALNQTDIHWIEEELLRIREEIFSTGSFGKEVFNKVLRGVEKEAIKVTRACKKCGTFLVKNGNEPKKIRTLIGAVETKRVRFRCQRCKEDIYPFQRILRTGKGVEKSSLDMLHDLSRKK
jgi:RNase P subunit RPR2